MLRPVRRLAIRGRAPLTAIFIVLALSTMTTVAIATRAIVSPDPSGVIHGCYNQDSGRIRVTDPVFQTCDPGEVAISWNQQGPKGDTGAQGAPGPSGVPGASGVPGPSGIPGASGVPGTSGVPGVAGIPGPSGIPGASGQPGPSGSPGTQLTSAAQLGGLACTANSTSGTLSVSYDGSGHLVLTCVASATPTPTPTATPTSSPTTGTVTIAVSGQGSVWSGTTELCAANQTCGVTLTGTVTLTAHYDSATTTFFGWGGACTGTGPCTLTMDGTAKSVSATFDQIQMCGGLAC